LHPPYFSLQSAILLFIAAVLGGALNAVAGGGSFIAFPALLFTGVPPVPANATNTVALWTGLAFSGGAFRHHLKIQRSILITLATVSLVGGVVGAILLLRTPAHTFLRILPWLMFSATLLFLLGPRLTRSKDGETTDAAATGAKAHSVGSALGTTEVVPSQNPLHRKGTSALVAAAFFQLLVGIYGGYFGGGMGIVILAMLTAFGMADIHEMNAFKIVLSTATNGIAVLIFILKHAVYWPQALVMIAGAALGGYFGAHYSLQLPKLWIRWFVIAVGTGMTAYFFVHAYTPTP
jgi:uncharacterized membrane protein YfcA